MAVTMNAKDVISAKLAECYATIEGRRYLLMQAKDLEAKVEKTKKEVNILGKTGAGNKSTGWKGTGKMTIYHTTSIFDKLLEKYKNTGNDTYFDIQCRNYDPTSAAEGQTVILKGCNLDDGVLASFDVDGDNLEQEVNFTYEDFEVPETFKELPGME